MATMPATAGSLACSIDGCERLGTHRICEMHRSRRRRGLPDALPPRTPAGIGRSCEVRYGDCVSCGGPYVKHQAHALTCSAACRMAKDRRRTRDIAVIRRGGREFECRYCGEHVVAEYGDKRRIHCSDDCSIRHARRTCGRTGVGRLRRRGAKRIRRLRPLLLDRYGGCCGICGRVIDTSLHWLHPLSLTIDHIHPLSAGGSNNESNLWPAHRRCNEDKGDEVGWRVGGLHLGAAQIAVARDPA
jgi:5-methylcytosine-specific restriction endonuclease McrA